MSHEELTGWKLVVCSADRRETKMTGMLVEGEWKTESRLQDGGGR